MDPLTILGAVSNIVSLVNAAFKAANICHEIYKYGASIDDLQSRYISSELRNCYSELNDSIKTSPKILSVQSNVDLKDLSEKCCSTARALHEQLEALRAKFGGRREAISKFFKSKRKAGEVEKLKERLNEYQKTLDTVISIDVRRIVTELSSQQIQENAKLNSTLKDLEASLASCRANAITDIKKAIEKATEAQSHQTELTRKEITSHMNTTMQHQQFQQQEDLFIESLRFENINLRSNEISESISKTFEWIYNDENEEGHPWDNFYRWLKASQRPYWISGKAGSGKSTLMSFIAHDPRTKIALKEWSAGRTCIILQFYFWSSGTKLQRSIKGFLCSMLRQAVIDDGEVLEDVFRHSRPTRWKRNVCDWSPSEARELLVFVVEEMHRRKNVCFLLDGIDEIDQDEEIQDLLALMKRLSKLSHVKLCISSRPEEYLKRHFSGYEKLHLQDLTKDDMKICIREKLRVLYQNDPPHGITENNIDELMQLMVEKADGVFLWVHLVLKSLEKGIRNSDDFPELIKRTAELPSRMEELYQQMWCRLNGDKQRYREEASTYFSYHEFFPLSLFQMMVIVRDDIREKYSHENKPQDPSELVQICKALKMRILTRCAGLVEVVNDSDVDEELTSKSESGGHHRLQRCYNAKIKFIHKTARDYLFDTKSGLVILGQTSISTNQRFTKFARAEIAAMLQGLVLFRRRECADIMGLASKLDAKSEVRVMEELRRACETLSISDSPRQNVNRLRFWETVSPLQDSNRLRFWETGSGMDFTTSSIKHGCSNYVQNFVKSENSCLSPYYRGWLFAFALNCLWDWKKPSIPKRIELANWLAQHSADLRTKQSCGSSITSPIQVLLEGALSFERGMFLDDLGVRVAKQTAQLVEQAFPATANWSDLAVVSTYQRGAVERRLSSEMEDNISDGQSFKIEMEIGCLCRLVTYCLRDIGVQLDTSGRAVPKSKSPMRVVFYYSSYDDPGIALTYEESVYTGELCEKLLFREEHPDFKTKSLQTEFYERLEEISLRDERADYCDWEYRIGLDADIDWNAPTLDPSEEIDESNWREKGLFRYSLPYNEDGRITSSSLKQGITSASPV